ncbi:MAG: hypothetical protein RJA22_2829, partial [Verrucomicrobiota bacterium]
MLSAGVDAVLAMLFLGPAKRRLAALAAWFGCWGGVLAPGLLAATLDGPLRMEVITAYNLVVDSNVESPSSVSPRAAHLGVRVYNDGATDLTNVVIQIGNLTNATAGLGTPGVFPTRTVTVSGANGYSGTFALQMPGGRADAVRAIPRIAAGQSSVQYFYITYPLKDSAGNSVAGAAPVPEDDLWLEYDFWASANQGVAVRRVNTRTRVTMRNEISAMANKVWPNTTGKVPDQYLDAIQAALGWRPGGSAPRISGAFVTEGIWYDLGEIGAGFDNNLDGIPDRNAWMQPSGDPATWDPLCARLVKCYGILIIKRQNGQETLIPFEDRLYFENLPEDNTGGVGLVFYEYFGLRSGCSVAPSPYQEVASGYDNEKFNGDYGSGPGTVFAPTTLVNYDKSVVPTGAVAPGGVLTYTLAASVPTNALTGAGNPDLGLPFTMEDSIPSGTTYVAGSATVSNVVPSDRLLTAYYSTNQGTDWSTTEPSASQVTTLRWVLYGGGLSPGSNVTARFQITVAAGYPSITLTNTGYFKEGPVGEIGHDTVVSPVAGINSVGDRVWQDDDRDGVQDPGESGITNITVLLYYDADGNGLVGPLDPLYAATSTGADGTYTFTNLPDARFITVVDVVDPQLPTGYVLPVSATNRLSASLDPGKTSATPVVVLTNDWGFIKPLEVVKRVSPTNYGAGELLTYSIDVENWVIPVPPTFTSTQLVYAAGVQGNRADQAATNAQGRPNNTFARLDYLASPDFLRSTNASVFTQTGSITKVELVVNTYLTAPLTDDLLDVYLGTNVSTTNLFTTVTSTQLNTLIGAARDYVIDVTSWWTNWSWADAEVLRYELRARRVGGGDGGTLWVDSLALRVTAPVPPPPAGFYDGNSLSPLPLTDTYDATKLQYVSASQPPTSVSPGLITWADVGPVNGGARKTITVTFLVLEPPNSDADAAPDPTTTLNTATSTGARFVSGLAANSDSGQVLVAIDPRGQIGDFVWWDANTNGVYDTGDFPLAGVQMLLSNGARTTTDASGYYMFSGLVDGTYTVTVDTNTLPIGAFGQSKDPDSTTNHASTVTINTSDGFSTNDYFLDRDFAYYTIWNAISGSLFQDNDGDGIQDAGENFLSGVTVTLQYDFACDGTYENTTFRTTTTDANGYYVFKTLSNACYRVVITQPSNTVQTLDPDGAIKNNSTVEQATGGKLYPTNNFAYQPVGTLAMGDTLYLDWNGDGDQDGGEDGIAGVEVWLYEDVNGNGLIDPETDALIATSVTSAGGVYGFSSLPATNYLVVVNTQDPQFPAGVLQVQDHDGVRDSVAVVALSTNLLTVDFGYQPDGNGSIGDTVHLDANRDGLWQTGEIGLAGITVTLYEDVDGNGVITTNDAVVGTTTTDVLGNYLFTGLRAGRYLVDVNATDSDIPLDSYLNRYRCTSTDPHLVTLGTGEAYLLADFGFAPPASIGDFVFYDLNGNGSQDWADPGIAGVTVLLYLDADTNGVPDGPPLSTQVTDASGFYRFTDLSAGSYMVQVVPPTGYSLTADPDRDGVAAGDNSVPGLPAPDNYDSYIALGLGSAYSGADFGFQPLVPAQVGDYVWLDADGDGVQDAGEPGLAGVTVRITNGSQSFTNTTDLDGYYYFTGLSDGTWTVSILATNFASGQPLHAMAATFDADGLGSSNVSVAVLSNGVVTSPLNAWCPGTNNCSADLDFGYRFDGVFSLSGTVVNHDTGVIGTADDLDTFSEDGVDRDLGPGDETELAEVPVYLYRSDGGGGWDLVAYTVTDPKGNYLFTGLPNGDYRVILSTTVAPLDTATLTTTTANAQAINPEVAGVTNTGTSVIQLVTLSGASVDNVDFAFYPNVEFDFGDLPDMATTLLQDGARHSIPSGGSTLYLGGPPDADLNGASDARALGDDLIGSDDEDGVAPLGIITWTNGVQGGSLQFSLTVPASGGWLVGYIDFNQDGDLSDPGEMVINQAVAVSGLVTNAIDIPAGTLDGTEQSFYARFRLLPAQPPFAQFAYVGEVLGGEVEDYLFTKPVGASIGDRVWVDANGDGVQNVTELGLGGVTVTLSGAASATMTTSDGSMDVDGDGIVDPRGYYRFTGLAPGSYTVTYALPAGYVPSYDEDTGISAPNNSAPVVLASGAQHWTADFGLEPLTASIGGQVRNDTDTDGSLSDPDNPIAFVVIQLWTDPNGDGDPSDGLQVGEAITDSSGNYVFSNVPTGNYVVVELDPEGCTSTADKVGANDNHIPVSLVGGVDSNGNDFLDNQPVAFALDISGFVYNDGPTNDNAFGADDTPISGVTLRLFLDVNGNGSLEDGETLLGETTTGTNGFYAFSGLAPGNYLVVEVDPSGFLSENDTQGPPLDNTIAVTLVAASSENNNFLDDESVVPMDFGDAPTLLQSGFLSSYPTTLSSNGARHVATGPLLGLARDSESDGQPTAAADGDDLVGSPDDEDGVSLPTLAVGQSVSVTVVASAVAVLDAWIDWNADGDWNDAGENVWSGQALAAGTNVLTLAVPCAAGATPYSTYARFRLSTAGIAAPTGLAADGEVEDYQVLVQDAAAPSASCPTNLAVNTSTGSCTSNVTFSATTTDNCPGDSIVCVPASGSAFAKGVTTVVCTATDASGNTNI